MLGGISIYLIEEERIKKYVDYVSSIDMAENEDKKVFIKQTKSLLNRGVLNNSFPIDILFEFYIAEHKLPENKLDLYQKYFEYIFNMRMKDKKNTKYNWGILYPIMKENTFIEMAKLGSPNNSFIDKSYIKDELLKAYKTKYENGIEAERAIDEFLKCCSSNPKLLVKNKEEKYKFINKFVFEYFYSLYIFLKCDNEKEILEKFLYINVDSEIFELTVAMLKKTSETKYQRLIELMLYRMEHELAHNKFLIFDIMILSMLEVDDVYYRERFKEIIIKNKNKISKNITNIHNIKLIDYIYRNDTSNNKHIEI